MQQRTFEEFANQYPEYCGKKDRTKSSRMKFSCQCKFGHVFDYRDREKFSMDNIYYAPCQGKCPVCGTIRFSFINYKYS